MLSFIIPAYNESGSITRCVTSIREQVPDELDFEVIVVDNRSEDDTAIQALQAGATVVPSSAGTIGAVRNAGVTASKGDILVFLDADCALTDDWSRHVPPVLARISSEPLVCAGSQVAPPSAGAIFLWKYWFAPFVAQESASHIGSAHMICSLRLFRQIEGFDERLTTGEDYDFCTRVRAIGGEIKNVPALRVEHYGFPQNWMEFINRERWHGSGDLNSFTTFRSSRVALTSSLFALSVAIAVLGGVFRSVFVTVAGLGLAVAIVLFTSIVKFRHAGAKVQAVSLLIIPVYFLARTLAILDRLAKRSNGRPSTARRA